VLELKVAALLGNLVPTIRLDPVDDVPRVHVY
jgi:hypothetical protein